MASDIFDLLFCNPRGSISGNKRKRYTRLFGIIFVIGLRFGVCEGAEGASAMNAELITGSLWYCLCVEEMLTNVTVPV